MNPSADSTEEHGDSTWAAQSWDQPVASVYCGLDSRHFQARRPDWDWENQMILAQHSSACSDDQDRDCKPNLMADTVGSGLRQYNGLVTANFPSSFPQNGWGVLNASTGIRNGGANMEASPQSFQATSDPIYAGLEMSGIGGFSIANCALGARSCFDHNQNQLLALVNMEQTRIHDAAKQEICSPVDFTTRLGLNLGGRMYFSREDSFLSRFGKRHRPNSPGVQPPMCQAEGCKADLSIAKHYHRRHKVCQYHSKVATVTIAGQTQRFCQQCSRFHVLPEFDEGKRSCRKRLADHNRRRRKPQPNLPSTTGMCTAESSVQKIDDQEEKKPSNNHETNGTPTKSLENCEVTSLLPAMSVTPNGPLMLQNGKTRISTLSGNQENDETQMPSLPSRSHGKKPYQQFLQGKGHAGSSLSLSTLGRGKTSVTTQRQPSQQIFGAVDITVPWLRPINSRSSDFLDTVARPAMTAVTGDCSPLRQLLEPGGHPSSMQALSHSIQNLLPLECNFKDHISHSDWMMKSLTAPSSGPVLDFVSQNANVAEKSESHHALSLFERGTLREVQSSEEECLNILPMEFLQQHLPSTAENLNGASDGNSITRNQLGIEFEGLQELWSFKQSSYNNTENVM